MSKRCAASLEQTFGKLDDSADGSVVTIRARSDRRAWAYAHFAVANAKLLRRDNGEDRKQVLANPGPQPPRLAGSLAEAQGRARRDHGSLTGTYVNPGCVRSAYVATSADRQQARCT